MKVIIIAGTRPEAIKVAALVYEFKKHPEIDVLLCNSGQHSQLIDSVFDDFKLIPDFSLNVMSENQSLASLTAKLFTSLDKVFDETNPDWVVVQGDTTTAMVSAMCAFYRNIKIAHVEAGLRSFDKKSPFPEESNRQIVTRIADLHFAPTRNSYANLIREGIDPDCAFITGNTVIDVLLWAKDYLKDKPQYLNEKVAKEIENGKRIILITAHRRENFGKGFEGICEAIRVLANRYSDCLFVYPVHLNPSVQKPVNYYLSNFDNILLFPPQSYLHFQSLLNSSYLILTDSGGIQEEASALRKPVLVMRDVTERIEGLKTGCSVLVGTNANSIIDVTSNILDDKDLYNQMVKAQNPYGHGHSAERIVEAIIRASEL
ncbi:MAG: non-hydrolyzing UDP-N-acetylglucosamine 2-epimerase [Succinivibrionaceae bacterium]